MNESAEHSAPPEEQAQAAAGIPISVRPITPPRPRPEPPRRERRNGVGGWLLIAACLLGAGYGLQAAGRRAAAEMLVRDGSPGGIEWATRISPGNALAWERLAQTGTDRIVTLRAIVALRPGDAAPRIELALELETRGDIAGAEAAFRQAVEADPGFLPRWTLANFYLRHGREDDFWTAIRASIAADPNQTDLAAALCWRAFDESALILERGVPDDPEALRAYFRYLIAERKLAALRPVWERYESKIRSVDMPALAGLLADLLAAGDRDFAVDVWNSLIDQGLLDFQPLSLPDGPYLTNSGFDFRVSDVGFDWTVASTPGVGMGQQLNPGMEKALEIRLSGGQAEYTLMLTQIAPVPEGADFLFSYEYATQQLPFLTGMGWRIVDHLTGQVLAESGSIEAAEDFWNNGEMAFHTPEGTRLIRLELHYQRADGTDRYRGRFVVRSVALAKANSAASGTDPQSGASR